MCGGGVRNTVFAVGNVAFCNGRETDFVLHLRVGVWWFKHTDTYIFIIHSKLTKQIAQLTILLYVIWMNWFHCWNNYDLLQLLLELFPSVRSAISHYRQYKFVSRHPSPFRGASTCVYSGSCHLMVISAPDLRRFRNEIAPNWTGFGGKPSPL